MNGDQMVQVTRFAVALDRMARAVKAGDAVTLSPDENAAMVATIRTLTAGINRSAPAPAVSSPVPQAATGTVADPSAAAAPVARAVDIGMCRCGHPIGEHDADGNGWCTGSTVWVDAQHDWLACDCKGYVPADGCLMTAMQFSDIEQGQVVRLHLPNHMGGGHVEGLVTTVTDRYVYVGGLVLVLAEFAARVEMVAVAS